MSFVKNNLPQNGEVLIKDAQTGKVLAQGKAEKGVFETAEIQLQATRELLIEFTKDGKIMLTKKAYFSPEKGVIYREFVLH